MRLPGSDHPITISANPKRVRISLGGVVIAETDNALKLKEASYPAVNYVPREDTNMSLLAPTERVTHCPYKGMRTISASSRTAKRLKMRSGPTKRRFRR